MTNALSTFLEAYTEAARVFRVPVMTNIYRAVYVEALLSVALRDRGWERMAPWDSWDLQHGASGVRLEVKQSAAAQSWASTPTRKRRPSFDIAPRTGYWDADADEFQEAPGCHADIHVFAWHGAPREQADHRDPAAGSFS